MAFATCLATPVERRKPLPGDGVVPEPMFAVTHASTINAPIERVWPWIAQMGSDRGGWYSWDAIDNGGKPSVSTILPGHQTVAPGDVMPAVPGAKDAFVVAAVDPPRDLVLTAPNDGSGKAVSWEHFLEPLANRQTRFIVRARVSPHWLDRARAGQPPDGCEPFLIERIYALLAMLPLSLLRRIAAAGHRIMEARHMRGIRRRSKRTAVTEKKEPL